MKLSAAQLDALTTAYRAGQSLNDLAIVHRLAASTIWKALRTAGVELRPRNKRRPANAVR